MNVEKVFCGFDYRFGNKGLGTPKLIEENGIEISVQKRTSYKWRKKYLQQL